MKKSANERLNVEEIIVEGERAERGGVVEEKTIIGASTKINIIPLNLFSHTFFARRSLSSRSSRGSSLGCAKRKKLG